MKEILNKILRKIGSVSDELPKFRYHVADQVVSFHDNYLCAVMSFDGIVFEAASDQVLENDFDELNRIYAEAARERAGRISFNTYLLRSKIDLPVRYEFGNTFVQNFADKYMARFNNKDYFDNRFYITILLKYSESIDEAINEMESILLNFSTKLKKYEPRTLTAYKNSQGILCSEVYEFFYEILNAEQVVGGFPLTGSPLYDVLPAATLHFGYEILQIKGNLKNRYASLFDLKDFPGITKQGMFNSASLSLPFEYNLVQSFTSLTPSKAMHRIESQQNQFRSTADKASHQHKELEEAQGYIQSGESAFGEYHCAMIVYGNSPKEAVQNGIYALASFSNNAGAIFRKATLSAPSTYFSQLPRHTGHPRKMIKSTRNLAATFPMHNYSSGKMKNNPLGDGSAVMPLETRSKTIYFYNFHSTNPNDEATDDEVAGHALVLGETGSGKTTVLSTMIAFASRFDPAMFILDKDRGMEIFVKALNGDYFTIEEGVPTGLNPFQFKDSPKLREFLNKLVVTCANDKTHICTAEEENQIKLAIDAVMKLEVEERRFGVMIQYIADRGGNEVYQRLLKWCEVEGRKGRFAWCLDNPINQFDADAFKILGFEVGAILQKDYQPTEPLLACLLYLKEEMVQKYRLKLTAVAEFWLALEYETTSAMIKDTLKTGRKRGEFMILDTQSPGEALKSSIFETVVQQTVTKILLPNTQAEYENDEGVGYKRIGLSRKEFDQMISLNKDSRTFLVKQGHQSSFLTLNLNGFDDEISVLSGNKKNVDLLDQILSYLPSKVTSDVWLPYFFEARRLRKQGKLNIDEFMKDKVTQYEAIAEYAQWTAPVVDTVKEISLMEKLSSELGFSPNLFNFEEPTQTEE